MVRLQTILLHMDSSFFSLYSSSLPALASFSTLFASNVFTGVGFGLVE